MKRALFDTVTVLPFASGNVVDRTGYESAVLAVTVEASQTATIKVETADSTAGPYEPVKDSRIFVDNPVNEDGEAVIENEAEAQAVANLDIDLIGCNLESLQVESSAHFDHLIFTEWARRVTDKTEVLKMITPVASLQMKSSYHFDNLILIRLQSSSQSGNLIRRELQIKLRKA